MVFLCPGYGALKKDIIMPRIRTVKPEFWTSEQVLECSRNARLAFIGMLNFCDDKGAHRASAKALKAEVFPGDDCAVEEVQSWVNELIEQGLVFEYEGEEDGGASLFWQVRGWHHQRIDKPHKAKYPRPVFQEHSTNIPRTFPPDTIGEEGIGEEGIGEERIGKEGRGKEGKRIAASAACAESEDPPREPSPVFILIPLAKNGEEAEVTETMIAEWVEAYPGVDICQELRNMRQWCIHNPKKRKTKQGVGKFMTAWLADEQDRGGRSNGGKRPPIEGTLEQMMRLEREGKI